MKVADCLSKVGSTPLGKVRMIELEEMGGNATERILNTFNVDELQEVQKRDAHAHYHIGDYWYILSTKPSKKEDSK